VRCAAACYKRAMERADRSTRYGLFLALLAAVSFGLTTPFVQRLGRGVGPFTTAALLYLGAAAISLLLRKRANQEAPLTWAHAPRLIAMALAGATVAPAALAWGLQRTSGLDAGLALNFEAVFTALLGWLLYREHVGRRVALALAAMTLGGMLLLLGRAQAGSTELAGLVAVTAATFAWGLDNALSSGVSGLDPAKVVLAKAALGALLSSVLALALGEHGPALFALLGLLACGATGFGLSLRLYLLAQRRIGAARTASLFAFAPFVAAGVALGFGEALGGWATLAALPPMLVGLALHLTERHAHAHRHPPLTHAHAHNHADGHHNHTHEPPCLGEHSHEHTHEVLEHDHSHLPDLHHDH
jgi:drug/metabolite transporter (DMT)-like permease